MKWLSIFTTQILLLIKIIFELGLINGVLERNRTPNTLIRSQVLYPIELRVLIIKKGSITTLDIKMAVKERFELSVPVLAGTLP